jgi:hypothetical protein
VSLFERHAGNIDMTLTVDGVSLEAARAA